MRADARRNRDAILRAAREAYEREGINAPIDAIAVAAGVGNATLYRNFPTRDDLVAAVMADTVTDAFALADALAADDDPAEALRSWLAALMSGLRIWQEFPTCIATSIVDDRSPVRPVGDVLTERTSELLERARATGAVRDEIGAGELFELLVALAWAADRFGDDAERAQQRVAFATSGLFA